jgi:hypothetical protein
MNNIYLSLTTRPERLASYHFNKVYTSCKNTNREELINEMFSLLN